MNLPPSQRVFIAGTSGSGKSTAAWNHYLARFPRRILIDNTGEWEDKADAVVYDVHSLAIALRRLAPRGTWTVSAEIDLSEIPALVDYLIPLPNIGDSPIRAMHGAVLLADEVDLIAPPRGLRQEVRTLWRRSRHAGLSIVATTQRPEAVSREVSSQCWQVLCLDLGEPAAIRYMAELMNCDLTPLAGWTRLHPHGGLWKDRRTGVFRWMTEAGAFVAGQAAPGEPSPSVDDDDAEPEAE